MRRLQVIRMYKNCNRVGGVQTRLPGLLPRLAGHVDVRLLCCRERGDRVDKRESIGVLVDVVLTGPKWAPWNVARYLKYFRRHCPDVVHTNEYTANTCGRAAARRANVAAAIRHPHSLTRWGWGVVEFWGNGATTEPPRRLVGML